MSIATARVQKPLSRQESWEGAFQKMQTAHSEAEIAAAEAAMRSHLRQWPEDNARDPWHGWEIVKAALAERKEQSAALGLTPPEFAERESLMRLLGAAGDFMSDPGVLDRYREIAALYASWLARFPNDATLRGYLTYRLRDIAIAEQCLRLAAEIEPTLAAAGR